MCDEVDYKFLVAAKLQLPLHCCRSQSPDRVVCIVNEDWLRQLFQGHIQQQRPECIPEPAIAEMYLARSCSSPPSPWTRFSVKVWPKSRHGLQGGVLEGMVSQSLPGTSILGLMSNIARENLHNLWLAAQQKYSAAQHHQQQQQQHPHQQQHARGHSTKTSETLADTLLHWIWRLAPDIHIHLPEDSGKTTVEMIDTTRSIRSQSILLQQKEQGSPSLDEHFMHNIARVLALIETEKLFLMIQPYVEYSLNDILCYSPAVLDSCYTKSLFILYQALQAMAALHARGMPVGCINPQTVMLDRDLWVYVVCPQKQALMPPSASSTQAGEEDVSGSDSQSGTQAKKNERNSSRKSLDSKVDRKDSAAEKGNAGSTDENEEMYSRACRCLQQETYKKYSQQNIEQVVEAWVHRELSNFEYLMILNHLAGRQMNDPNNHPVLPWVMDFSSPHDGYRDLTKSKFRLNKGDSQLDFTYGLQTSYSSTSLPVTDDPDHIAHHVSDVLSDITYYVYKARRMPKSVLCAYVRSNWVPHEYPASMQRMQEWTPDECIPEFFTDPVIFRSIHSDLADLEIPPWCSSDHDFVVRHLAVLESERVSEQLHHWIDLTFGYKLSGKAAVAAKNVYLQLVDGHQTLRNHGVLQLFSQPHPQRHMYTHRSQSVPPRIIREVLPPQMMHARRNKSELEEAFAATETAFDGGFESARPEHATIHLPKDYNPLAELEQCEALLGFRSKTLLLPSKDFTQESKAAQNLADARSRQNNIVMRDTASFLCLLCEMCLSSKLRMQGTAASLKTRVEKIHALCGDDYSALPRPFQRAAKLMSHLNVSEGEAEDGGYKIHFTLPIIDGYPPPTPSLLLHPHCDILPFPPYFPSLYKCLCRLKATDQAMEEVQRGTESPAEKTAMLKQFARSKIPVLERFLLFHSDHLGQEGLQLVLPLIDSLLKNKLTTVQAAWELFNIVGRALGPSETAARFLPSLTALFSELPASAKHVKLYHRTFLTQLLVRLHMQPFLQHFGTLLVEAVAGYKDFVLPSRFYPQELLEEIEQTQDDQQQDEWLLKEASHSQEELFRPSAQSEVCRKGHGSEEGVEGVVDEGDGFVDQMSLGEEGDIGDDLDLDLEGEEESESVEEPEPTSDSADRCSIHSISNILVATRERQSAVAEDEDDRVFESPRSVSEGGMFKPASGTSLASLKSDSPTRDLGKGGMRVPSSADQRDSSGEVDVRTKQGGSPRAKPRSNTEMKPLKIDVQSGDSGAVGGSESDRDETRNSIGLTGAGLPTRKESIRRSETEDLMSSLSVNSPSSTVNIRHIAADSVKWLTHKLGPVLAARYLSRNLVRMLPLCYLGDSQLQSLDSTEECSVKTSRRVVGDGSAAKVLECAAFVASVYGENVVTIQYLPSIMDLVAVAQRRLTQRSESGLLGAVVLLRFVVPLLSDKTLMDVLEETIVGDCISPVLSMLTSTSLTFPSAHVCRSVLCHKLIDLLYVLGLRLGLEMSRKFLHLPMLTLMDAFTVVHAPEDAALLPTPSPVAGCGSQDESYVTIKMDSATHQYTIGTPVNPSHLAGSGPPAMSLSPNASRWHSLSAMGTVDDRDECLSPRQDTAEKCRQELAAVFTPELALAAYIPLCRIFGSIHMEETLKNDDLIRQLCAQHDSSMDQPPPPPPVQAEVATEGSLEESAGGRETVSGGLGSNVQVVGNRIQLADVQQGRPPSPTPSVGQFGRAYKHDGILQIKHDDLRSHEMEHCRTRHLRGNWLQYWEHELGLHERDTVFNFKQIKLQTFQGHTNSIRSILPMDTENCFISASKDKTVRLWSLTSCGDGNSKIPCQWTYQHHKKSVFSVAYVESMRQVASCDSTVHVWDPFTGVTLCQLESQRYSPAVALQAVPAPSPLVLMGTTEATLRFLDLRTHKYAHEFRCSTVGTGLLRCVAVSPDGSWVAVGFSTGVVSILDLNSGMLQASWKAHEGEILQMKAFNRQRLVSSSFDGTLKVWNIDGSDVCHLKGPNEPVHCFSFYRDQVLSATTANRIGVHSVLGENATFTSTKMRSNTFRGVLTSMAVLPLNRVLLLGSDNGNIELIA